MVLMHANATLSRDWETATTDARGLALPSSPQPSMRRARRRRMRNGSPILSLTRRKRGGSEPGDLALLDETPKVPTVNGDRPPGAAPARAAVTCSEADGDLRVPVEASDDRLEFCDE